MENKLKLSWFTKRRLSWVGANEQILEKCPSEIPKYVGFGTTILVTAMLASVSGGYAIYAISGNSVAPFLFGPLWGFLIFNLDSVIVTSMRKPKIPSKDETILWVEKDVNVERQTVKLRARRRELKFKQFYLFFVRFIVAVILGFIISMPLETLIFSKRIHKKWGIDKQNENVIKLNELIKTKGTFRDERQSVTKAATTADSALYETPRLKKLKERNDELSELNDKNELKINQQESIRKANTIKHVDSLGKVHFTPNRIAINASNGIKNLNNEIFRNEREIQENNQNINSIIKDIEPESKKIKAQADKDTAGLNVIEASSDLIKRESDEYLKKFDQPDLIEQIEILSTLRENKSVLLTSILITLLFVIIEVAPVSVKFLTPRGVYDELLELKEMELISNERYDLHKKFASISSNVKVETAKTQQRTDTEIDIYKKAMDDLANNRSNIIKELIKKSEEDEINKIRNNNMPNPKKEL